MDKITGYSIVGLLLLIVLIWVIWEWAVTIIPFQIFLILPFVLGAIILYVTRSVWLNWKTATFNGGEPLIIAKKYAMEKWNEDTEEILKSVGATSVSRVHQGKKQYIHYGFIFQKAESLEKDREVWIVVEMDEYSPTRIVTWTDDVKIGEKAHETINEKVENIWNLDHPYYAGAPAKGVVPEADIKFQKTRRPKETFIHYDTKPKEKEKGIADKPEKEEEGK